MNPLNQQTLSDGTPIYLFNSLATPIVKLDILRSDGIALTPQPLLADATAHLHLAAGAGLTAQQLSEYLEHRGILVDHSLSPTQTQTTIYFLRRHANSFLPLLARVMQAPSFPQTSLSAYQRSRRQKITLSRQKAPDVARRLFYRTLLPQGHPLATFPTTDDVDNITTTLIANHYHTSFARSTVAVVLAGDIDHELLAIVDSALCDSWRMKKAQWAFDSDPEGVMSGAESERGGANGQTLHTHLPNTGQTSIRIGRIIPLRWDTVDFAQFLILSTALGGYFGSRLMTNLREDKGYTYAISASTLIHPHTIVFNIVADIAAGKAAKAMSEIRCELDRLIQNPIPDEELALVARVIKGNLLRSIDGVFERSDRLCNMLASGIDDSLTSNINNAINQTTARQLQELAGRLFDNNDFIYCSAGY